MAGLTREQVTYQVAQWAANDPEVLKRAREIIGGRVTHSTFPDPMDLLAAFIGDIVHTNGNGFCHTVDAPQGKPINWDRVRPFWDLESIRGLRKVVGRYDFYVVGVDWDAVVEELKPE
ncbi:hypothetical protein ABT282_07365 [Streptomyces sp. NPDC000927]|uniref:hypothetical protein n=1 Tax=Streptomyces sp. NPDC000927 TaxID=3154371 RepID=UPI003329EA1E